MIYFLAQNKDTDLVFSDLLKFVKIYNLCGVVGKFWGGIGDRGVNILSKFRSLTLTVWERSWFEDLQKIIPKQTDI